MDRKPVLEGERLLLRPLAPEDWEALYAVASDRELWAQHPNHDRWQESVFRRYFEEALVCGGAVAIVDMEDGQPIGSSRWDEYDAADGGSVEIGWTFLARSHWGGRSNAELKRLMVGHALGYVRRVIFKVAGENWRSRRAMEKIGGRLTDQTMLVETASGTVVYVLFEITREEFANGPLAA